MFRIKLLRHPIRELNAGDAYAHFVTPREDSVTAKARVMLPNYIARNWLRASIDEAAQAYADGEADGDGGGERPTLIGSRVVGLVGRRMGRNSS